MPIQGISDVERLPRIGKVRLGIKRKKEGTDYSYPEKTDYFVMDPDDKAVMEEIRKVYGEKPRALDIMFASDDFEQVFPQYLKRYAFGTRMCKGDGNTGTATKFEKKIVNGKETSIKVGEEEVSCKGCQYQKEFTNKAGKKVPKRCKPLASLMVLLPRIPGIGAWQLDTGSYHSIVNVNAGLKIVRQLYKRISGVPLKLLLSPKTVNADGRAKVVYVISLSIEGTLENALKSSTALPGEAPKNLLPAPDEEHAEDHFPAEEEAEGEIVEEQEEAPPEEETEEEVEQKPAIPPTALFGRTSKDAPGIRLKIVQQQVKSLGYSAKEMSAYILKTFKKKVSTAMTGDEIDVCIKHLARIILLVEVSEKIFTRKEMESGAKKMYKAQNMLEMSEPDLDKYDALIRRSLPKHEEE